MPIGISSAAVIFLLFKTPSTLRTEEASLLEKVLQMDFIGTFLIIAATVCYLLAMEWGGITKPWGSADVIVMLVLFPVLVLVFALNEWLQGDKAQLSFKILKDRTLLVVCVFAFL